MRSKVVVLSACFLCMLAQGYSQQPAKGSKLPAAGQAGKMPASSINDGNSLLWEISGRGLTNPSYLYGTMHIVCEDDAILSEGLKKVIADAKKVYFEVDMDNMEEMMSVIRYARMNNGLKLTDLVSPLEYERIESYFKENKSPLPLSMMSRFKPYFISAMIGESLMTCDNKSSIEQQIMNEVKKTDKEIGGLETVEFQASLFDSIPYEKQARDLVAYVDSIDQYRKITLDLMDLYRKQDVMHMDSLIRQSDPGMTNYLDLLLYDRNRRWTAQISEQAFMQPTLFAVGAGHLGGDKGVIALLRKQGFTVTAMRND